MPSQKCLENIASSEPPGNVPCPQDVCIKAQQRVDRHCMNNGYRPDDPWVIFYGPDLTPCSCCCSCFGHDTPIEARPGVFAKVQDIQSGDTVLTAGKDLVWEPAQVAFASGMEAGEPALPVLNVVYRFDQDDVRLLQVTDDTLFLMTDGLLKSAGVLAPGDRLRRADGGEAEIIGPVTKAQAVSVHSIEMGPFDGVNLDGHLLNTYGVVTADLSVQRMHTHGDLRDDGLVDRIMLEEDTPVAGTEEYLTRHRATKGFLDEVEAAGIRLDPSALEPPRPLVTIPPEAKGFLHREQAERIRAAAPLFSSNNTFRITVAQKMIDLARPRYGDVVMLIDWNNNLPGAYAWTQLRQKYVVVTGGLLRIKPLTEAGLALVLTHVLAYHEGAECVGEADYVAINDLRRIWPPSLFPTMCQRAFDEIKTVFGYVDEAAEEDPDDRCERPSLDCRTKAYAAAMAMQPVPDCALPEGEPRQGS